MIYGESILVVVIVVVASTRDASGIVDLRLGFNAGFAWSYCRIVEFFDWFANGHGPGSDKKKSDKKTHLR